MSCCTWKLGPMHMVEVTGEGRRIVAGQRTVRTVVQATAMIGPEKLLSLRIVPLAVIVAGPGELYAISMDGKPADVPSLLEMIS